MNNLMGPKNSSSSRSQKFEPGDSKVLGALFLYIQIPNLDVSAAVDFY